MCSSWFGGSIAAPMSLDDEIAKIKGSLEAADASLVDALNQRAEAVRQLLALKEKHPEGYFRLPRDEEVMRQARERAASFPEQDLEPVLREVLSACAALAAPRSIAYMGTEGSFAHVAARSQFGARATFHAYESVRDVLDEVMRGRASFGILPLETSSDGALTETLHGLAESDTPICAETTLASTYHLLSKTGNASDIEKIYGAPQALAACERFLRTRFARATVLDVPSGDVAAQFAASDHGAAAVGTSILSELHDLRPVHERIEDSAGVETRFAIVGGGTLPSRTGTDRTVLAMAVHDEPGALYNALHPFADRGINLTRLESRPAPGAVWRYLFFVEMDGHVTDRAVLTALEELRRISRHVKVLGSYPRPD